MHFDEISSTFYIRNYYRARIIAKFLYLIKIWIPFQPLKPLSSTPKTPQFNTSLSSTPKTEKFWCGTEWVLVLNWGGLGVELKGFRCWTEGFLVLNRGILGAEKVWSLCWTYVLKWGGLCETEGYSYVFIVDKKSLNHFAWTNFRLDFRQKGFNNALWAVQKS